MMESVMLNGCKVAVAGAGTMGMGIAQVAAMSGHETWLYDPRPGAVEKAIAGIQNALKSLSEKGKITAEKAEKTASLLHFAENPAAFQGAGLFIEAIVEDLKVKRELFSQVEAVLAPDAILASNTSSLSVTSIAASCKHPQRVLGLHFFNPAPLMPLVEVIPALQTNTELISLCADLMRSWNKVPVVAKDTPGFIVNRLARSFYGESLRILEEGIADIATIDYALKTKGGFKMGPFELMDLIGNDVNYTVTETVWTQMYFDQRYKPSLIQKKLLDAGHYGRKSGKGYYDYSPDSVKPEPDTDPSLAEQIFSRVIAMLINEAADAYYLKIATAAELDLAMTKGVNYPKGLLQWADEMGADVVLNRLEQLYEHYREDRYRPSVQLRKMASEGVRFF